MDDHGRGRRRLDAYSQDLLGEGQEVLINPDFADITKALSRVQVRTRTNRLTADEALAFFRRVAQEGHRVATHSEQSVAAIGDNTKSALKWNVNYGDLIKRFGLTLHACAGYPDRIFIYD